MNSSGLNTMAMKPTLAQNMTKAQRLREQLDEVTFRVEEELRTRPQTPANFAEMSAVQQRADSVYKAIGWQAPPAYPGESRVAFRRRLLENIMPRTPKWKDTSPAEWNEDAINTLEPMVFADAVAEAERPTMLEPGEMREVKRRDESGRDVTEFFGAKPYWLDDFKGDRLKATFNQRRLDREMRRQLGMLDL